MTIPSKPKHFSLDAGKVILVTLADKHTQITHLVALFTIGSSL